MKPENKTKRYADRDGLTLEVRLSGNKIFLFRFQWDKKPQTITLGRYPSLSIIEVRNLASKHRASLNSGIDPRVTVNGGKEDQITLKAVAELWVEKNKPQWREATIILHQRSLFETFFHYLVRRRLMI